MGDDPPDRGAAPVPASFFVRHSTHGHFQQEEPATASLRAPHPLARPPVSKPVSAQGAAGGGGGSRASLRRLTSRPPALRTGMSSPPLGSASVSPAGSSGVVQHRLVFVDEPLAMAPEGGAGDHHHQQHDHDTAMPPPMGGGLAGLVSPRHYVMEDDKPPPPERCTHDHFVLPPAMGGPGAGGAYPGGEEGPLQLLPSCMEMSLTAFLAKYQPSPANASDLQLLSPGAEVEQPVTITRLAVRNARRQDTSEDLYRFLELQEQGGADSSNKNKQASSASASPRHGGGDSYYDDVARGVVLQHHPHHEDARSLAPRRLLGGRMQQVLGDMWKDWQRLKRTQQATAEALFDLGRRFGYGMGQWVVYVGQEEVNAVWERVARAAHRGLLGPLVQVTTVHEASVTRYDGKGGSPRQRLLSPTRRHSILVSVDPYWHQPEVDRVLRVLRQHCGIKDRALRFVPDFVDAALTGRKHRPAQQHQHQQQQVGGGGEHEVSLSEVAFYQARAGDTFSTRVMGGSSATPTRPCVGSPTVHERRPGEDRLEFVQRLKPSKALASSSAASPRMGDALYLEHADSVRDVEELYEELLLKQEVAMSIYANGTQPVMDHINAEWEQVLSQHEQQGPSGQPLEEVLWDLGRRYGYGRGRWRLHVAAARVDTLWERITQSLCEGSLGPAAEVSGPTMGCPAYTISVLVDPYWDHARVDRALQEVRALGFTEPVSFHADLLGDLGYTDAQHNPLRLQLHLYEAASLASTSTRTRPSAQSGAARSPVGGGNRQQLTCRETETVENFLRRVKPSCTEVEGQDIVMYKYELRDALLEHMAKVMALASGASSSSSSPASPSSLARQASELTDRFTRSWQQEVGASPASREAMWSLCKRYGLGLAYWKIRPERASVDGLWSRVARAVDRGRLGHEARCRTFRRRSAEGEVVAVSEVSFAVFPFWDRSQVERILVAVRQEVGYHDAALLVADAAGQYCDGDDDTLQALSFYEAQQGSSVPHCLVGPLTVTRQADESAADFVARVRPSEADEMTAWIETRNPAMAAYVEEMAAERRAAGRHIVPQSCSALEQVRREWEALVAEGRHTRHELWLLGRRYGISSGYWVWEVRPDRVDETWAQVVVKTDENQLGPTARLLLPGPSGDRQPHIFVQVDPYWSMEEVQAVLSRLRAAKDLSYVHRRGVGVSAKLSYYPEVALQLGLQEPFYEADERADAATCLLAPPPPQTHAPLPTTAWLMGGVQDGGARPPPVENLLAESRLDEEPIDSFLSRLRPSDGDGVVQWYCISNPERALLIQRQYEAAVSSGALCYSLHTHGPLLMDQVYLAWESGRLQGLWSGNDNTSLFELGRQFGFGCGRWVLRVPPSEVDRVWARVAVETDQGSLGFFAEVAPSKARHCSDGLAHTINIYVDPYWDVAEVQRTLQVIRSVLDVGVELHFIPEIARALHLRAHNPFNLCTTLYYAPPYSVDLRRTTCTSQLPMSFRNSTLTTPSAINTTAARPPAYTANQYLSPRAASSVRNPWSASPAVLGPTIASSGTTNSAWAPQRSLAAPSSLASHIPQPPSLGSSHRLLPYADSSLRPPRMLGQPNPRHHTAAATRVYNAHDLDGSVHPSALGPLPSDFDLDSSTPRGLDTTHRPGGGPNHFNF